ncbi:MAG: hypothetical protein AB2A00_16700 [Myxococcota bacterium]
MRVRARVGWTALAVALSWSAWAAAAQDDNEASRWSLTVVDETRGPVALREVRWSVDGGAEEVRAVTSSAKGEPITVHQAALPVGGHALHVTLVYEGTGYGLFSYHRGYHFLVQRDHGLVLDEGQHTRVTVVGRDAGPLGQPFPEKAALQVRTTQEPLR